MPHISRRGKGVHLVRLTDDEGKALIAASLHPCERLVVLDLSHLPLRLNRNMPKLIGRGV